MKAKTIFLNDKDEVIIYENVFHMNNHDNYIKKYYSNLKITDYIPIVLTNYNHCVIDLSEQYQLGVIYLPQHLSDFQKNYFITQQSFLEQYILYLNGYSLTESIPIAKLLSFIKK